MISNGSAVEKIRIRIDLTYKMTWFLSRAVLSEKGEPRGIFMSVRNRAYKNVSAVSYFVRVN